MSILPEMIIQQTLIRGFRAFREDERLLGMLFRNVDSKELAVIRQKLRDNSVEICINYPDQDIKIPSIVILLKNEAEAQPFIGDLQQSVTDFAQLGSYPFPKDELVGAQTSIGSGSETNVGLTAPLLLRPTRATGGSASVIIAPMNTTALLDPYEETGYVVVMEGTAAGDRREISSIVPDIHGLGVFITVTSPFTTSPDATSIFKIVGAVDNEITGEPAQLYASTDKIERMGTIFKSTYQLDMAASSPEEVIYLYNIVKAIFFVANGLMIKQGIMTFVKMSGTDMAPITEYYPSMAYRRSLSLEFHYSFDVFREITEPLASTIQIALSVHEDVQDVNSLEVEVSSTSFDTD